MPAVLKNAVEKSYADCGWNLVRSTNRYGEDIYPSFADVARNIKEIIDTSEYDSDNKGAYKGSLLTRLQSLTNGINGMIFTCDEIAAADLFDKNVIVDLSRVGSSETKSLIMGMLVLKLQEHRMALATGMNEKLKHITVLEEAHNLHKSKGHRCSVKQRWPFSCVRVGAAMQNFLVCPERDYFIHPYLTERFSSANIIAEMI